MIRSRVVIHLHANDLDRLRSVARGMAVPAGTLAARLVEQGLASLDADQSGRPTAALFDWLGPKLDRLRSEGGWSTTITAEIFNEVKENALHLYESAALVVDKPVLNREIGRFVRERLQARVIKRNGKPVLFAIPAAKKSLIKVATLIEPFSEHPTGSQ